MKKRKDINNQNSNSTKENLSDFISECEKYIIKILIFKIHK